MRCVSAPSDVTEVATCRETVRRALLTETDEPQLRTTQLQNAFLPPNAGVKPRRTRRMGASIARMPGSFNEATTRRRLERLVRREGSR